MALENVHIVVDPALLGSTVGQRGVALAQLGHEIDQRIRVGLRVEGAHPDAVIGVIAAVGVVVKVLFVAVEDDGNPSAS